MRPVRDLIARLRGTITRRDMEARLDEEIHFHLDMDVERRVRDGVPIERARRDAVVAFGGRESWREAARDEYRARTLEGLWQDLRHSARLLRKSPGFTAVALLTFALGIGANTAVFSVVSGVLLRPLPYANPHRLARIWPASTISNAELEYLQRNAASFAAVAAFSPGWGIALTGSGEPRQLDGARVSINFFQTLGVRPLIGRVFAVGESDPGRWDVAVLSHALWITQFGGDRSVVGRVVNMDGTPTRVVGVMPASFEAFQPGVDAWLPLQIDPSSPFYTGQTALGFGRLSPTASLSGAAAEVASMVPRMRALFNYSDDYGRNGTVVGLRESLVGDVRLSLLVLLGAVAFVLLIAGANVGNLMLVHAVGRRRELAVRRALGASRFQVARQMLVQSLLIAVSGGVLGIAVGFGGVRGLKAILPVSLPRLADVSIDSTVLLVTAGITLGVGVVFGVAPALLATRVDPDGALRVQGVDGRGGGAMIRQGLVVVEIALAMVLVVGAGLMTESLWRLNRVALGFDPRGVLSFRLQPSSGQVKTPAETNGYFSSMVDRMRALPGVSAVGGAQHLPLSGFNWNATLDIEREPIAATATHPRVVWRSVVGDYFAAMRIPLLRGRLFAASDTREAPAVVVISEAMAKHYWPGRDPIGERIRVGNASRNGWATIVGVAGSVRSASPASPPVDELYRPNTQQGLAFMHMVVRTSGNPLSIVPSVRTAVRALDTSVPIAEVQSLGELFSASTAAPRTIALLLLAFAGVGLALGAIGIYGVISYAVSQRTRELGIRVALGAGNRRIVGMVLGQGARLTGIGLAIGVVAALLAARSLRTMVFGVGTTDVPTYVVVAIVLAIAAMAASMGPAMRAGRVDPVRILNGE